MASDLWDLVRCPETGSAVTPRFSAGYAAAGGLRYRATESVCDLIRPLGARNDEASRELADFHDAIFSNGGEQGQVSALYDTELWTPLIRSAHERRVELLESIELPDLRERVVVDFGTGPWGFAQIYPRLQQAGYGIGFDVSYEALLQNAEVSRGQKGERLFLASDGDSIPLVDDCVDVLFAGEVIEHVRLPELFLQETARVLRPDGLLILTTPNRDAALFEAEGLVCTIGPEHIALLNAEELREGFSRYFEEPVIWGYEVSVSRFHDRLLRDQQTLSLLQRRGKDYPQASSGMVAFARKDAERFARNRRRRRRTEMIWSDERIEISDGSSRLELFGGIDGALLPPSGSAMFTVGAESVSVLLWSHDWSGVVGVEVEGERRDVNLYSPVGGFRRIELPAKDARPRRVRLTRTGERDERAQSDQVILYKVLAYETLA